MFPKTHFRAAAALAENVWEEDVVRRLDDDVSDGEGDEVARTERVENLEHLARLLANRPVHLEGHRHRTRRQAHLCQCLSCRGAQQLQTSLFVSYVGGQELL